MLINVLISKMAFARWKRRISMRGIIGIFSHDFIIIVIMISVIRWRNIISVGVCLFWSPTRKQPKPERNLCWLRFCLWHSRHRRQNGSRSGNLHQDPSMNSIPQSFLQDTPPKAFEREENLLSDGTKIQLTAHQHSARTELVSPD